MSYCHWSVGKKYDDLLRKTQHQSSKRWKKGEKTKYSLTLRGEKIILKKGGKI